MDNRARSRRPRPLSSAALCLPIVALMTAAAPMSAAAAVEEATAPAPNPGPRQSCVPSLPATATTSRRDAVVQVRLDASCPLGASAGWRVVSPAGVEVDRVTLTGRRAGTVTIPTTGPRSLGRYRLMPVFGHDVDYGQLVVVPGSIVVKASSTLSAAAAPRSITVAATKYDPTATALRPWSGATAALQRSRCVSGTCTWATVQSTRTDAAGRATFVRPAAVGAASFRIVTTPTSAVGGRAVAVAPR